MEHYNRDRDFILKILTHLFCLDDYYLHIRGKIRQHFRSENFKGFFYFAFFRVIYNNLHTFKFLYVMLCNNKAIWSINYLFIAFFSFLIFDYEYLFTYYILLIQRKHWLLQKLSKLIFLWRSWKRFLIRFTLKAMVLDTNSYLNFIF